MSKNIPLDIIDPSPYQHRRTFASSKLQELANSIGRDGLIEPIVIRPVNGRFELIAGERRLRAARLIDGYSSILSRIVEVSDIQARRMCAAENLQREDLSAIEEVEAIIEMVDAELIEDEEYQGFGKTPKDRVKWLLGRLASIEDSKQQGIDIGNSVYNNIYNKFIIDIVSITKNLPSPIEWRSFYNNDLPLITKIDQDVAQFAAENKLNKSQTKQTQKLKTKAPTLFEEIKRSANEEGVATARVMDENYRFVDETFSELSAREIAMLGNKLDRVQPVFNTPVIPDGTFNVVYADPPWQYNNAISSWGPATLHYSTLPFEKICNYPKENNIKVADDAVLFLWVTNPFLQDAFTLVEAWGFKYKTNIVWIKTELKRPGSGFYVRGRHELLFICTRGSFTPLNKNISPPIGSVIEAPLQEHSKKPDCVYSIIETLYPDCNYIELFARQARAGWSIISNEVIDVATA